MIDIPNCGYNSRHLSPFRMQHTASSDYYLILLVKTPAYFILDGRMIETAPNMAMLIEPHYAFSYGSDAPGFNDDWIHFRFLLGEDLVRKMNIPFHTPLYVPNLPELSAYMRQLMQDRYREAVNAGVCQEAWLKLLLCHLNDQYESIQNDIPRHKHYGIMCALRSDIGNNPSERWTVDRMADCVHMSPSYFQHLYKRLFGISCMQDVIQIRIENAKFYLKTSDMSIQSLSEFLGYETDLHFMRQFKKRENMTPSEYRLLSRAITCRKE